MPHRTTTAAIALSVLLCAAGAPPAAAQRQSDPNQRAILVMPFASKATEVSPFGDSLATRLISRLNETGEFRAVSWEEANSKLPVHMKGANCVVGQQAAVRSGTPLLLCGWYESIAPGKHGVHASIVVVARLEIIEIASLEGSSVEQAAQHIIREIRKRLPARLTPARAQIVHPVIHRYRS
jgi:hypothetical protein